MYAIRNMEIDELISGYRVPYDPRPMLEEISSNRDKAIESLWENLYHQGDVDTASYYSIPMLVDAGELSLVSAIEVARHEPHNPDIPEDFLNEYKAALKRAIQSSPSSEEHCLGYYIIHAIEHGQLKLAKALHLMDISEVIETYG